MLYMIIYWHFKKALLPCSDFFKIHRSHIININFLDSGCVKMKDGQKIIVSGKNRIYVLPIDTIVRCESADTCTMLFLKGGEKIVSLKQLGYYERYYESILSPDNNFFRIHRSHIININFLDSISKNGYVRLKNDVLLPISKLKTKSLVDYLVLKNQLVNDMEDLLNE